MKIQQAPSDSSQSGIFVKYTVLIRVLPRHIHIHRQLASKSHLAIFAFVRSLNFFHSAKKVSKPSIFCEIICVSKKTLVILIMMLCCIAFFKARNFGNFIFSFICMIFKWGGDFMGGNFLRGNFHRGQFSIKNNYVTPEGWGMIIFVTNCYKNLGEVGVYSSFVK